MRCPTSLIHIQYWLHCAKQLHHPPDEPRLLVHVCAKKFMQVDGGVTGHVVEVNGFGVEIDKSAINE